MLDLHARIAALRAEIERQETELSALEAELIDLERELRDFTARYDRLIRPLLERLAIVRDAIAELEAQQRATALGYTLADDTGWTPPPGYVPVEEQYRRTWKTPSPGFTPTANPRADLPIDPERPETALRTLYRRLVRRYHPDLATDPEERAHRNRLMTEINAAYAQQDLPVLRTLAQVSPADGPGAAASADEPLAALELQQLQQIHDQLARRIGELARERITLLNSDLMKLKVQSAFAAREGRDLLREMAAGLEQDYAAALRRLDALRGID